MLIGFVTWLLRTLERWRIYWEHPPDRVSERWLKENLYSSGKGLLR